MLSGEAPLFCYFGPNDARNDIFPLVSLIRGKGGKKGAKNMLKAQAKF